MHPPACSRSGSAGAWSTQLAGVTADSGNPLWFIDATIRNFTDVTLQHPTWEGASEPREAADMWLFSGTVEGRLPCLPSCTWAPGAGGAPVPGAPGAAPPPGGLTPGPPIAHHLRPREGQGWGGASWVAPKLNAAGDTGRL